MLENLKRKNPEISLYSVEDPEFASYGRIVPGVDADAMIQAALRIENPETGAAYKPHLEELAQLPLAAELQNRCFGTLTTQVGYCWGHNQTLDATEWHTSSEINIAATPLVLLLAHRWDIADGKLDSSAFRAFYVPAGMTVELYATSLHFTPCQVSDEGFGCIVVLPQGTNVPLNEPAADPVLFRQNKWVLCHVENETLKDRGVVPGITGWNRRIEY